MVEQEAADAEEVKPREHAVQVPPELLANVPAAHGVQTVPSKGETVPAGQMEHTVADAIVPVKRPYPSALQGDQYNT